MTVKKCQNPKEIFHTLQGLIENGYSARSVRYALLTTHYRKPLNFSFDLLKQAQSSLKRLDEFVYAVKSITKTGSKFVKMNDILKENKDLFEASLDDDLNISEAMAAVFAVINFFYDNQDNVTKENADEILEFISKADNVLGFFNKGDESSIDNADKELIEERNRAKSMKDFKRADEIRASCWPKV